MRDDATSNDLTKAQRARLKKVQALKSARQLLDNAWQSQKSKAVNCPSYG